MRVLHVSAYYAPAYVYGGPPRSIHALCRALLADGIDVQVFTTDAGGARALPRAVSACRTFEGVPVRYFPRSFPPAPIGSRRLAAALRREVGSFDLVHVHGLWNRVVWSAAREASRAGVPYVLSTRGMLEPAARRRSRWRKRAIWALADSHVVRGASLLHATSEIERETLAGLGTGIPVALVPNGVEIEPSRMSGPAEPLILFVGRLHPIKRLDLLIDAFAAAAPRYPDARLVIAGPDECGLRHELTVRAGRHRDALTWVGPVDDHQRRALLARAAALVLCSDSESFGMSVLEAMAASVPVIVTRTCGWSDVARYGAGYRVEQRVDALSDAIARILADPAGARAMGERGRALAGSSYRWSSIAGAMAASYRTLRPAITIADLPQRLAGRRGVAS